MKNNITAFPAPIIVCGPITPEDFKSLNPIFSGMTLRDYFASKALVGVMSNDNHAWVLDGHKNYTNGFAKVAYAIADAMLAEREEREKEST